MPIDARAQARSHLERASGILAALAEVGDRGDLVNPAAAAVYIAQAHAEAVTGHGWAALAATETPDEPTAPTVS